MSKIFFDSGISLDGYFAGNNRGPSNPMGGVSGQIHQWMFHQRAFWEHLAMEGGEEDGADGDLIRQTFERAGAYIMGKRMFEEGIASWPNDLFKADVFVLTNEKRDPLIQEGSTRFIFVNEGIHSALEKARASANGKDIRIQGGAKTIQQYLKAGLVEEFFIHIAPVFLGTGIRLFEGLDPHLYKLEIQALIPSERCTHIRYQLKKD